MTIAIFAIEDHCPHKGGPLSQGIVHGAAVTCPLHNWVISLETGKALGADEGSVQDDPGQGRGRPHLHRARRNAAGGGVSGHDRCRSSRGEDDLPLLRGGLRRAGQGRRGRRGVRPRRPRPSGQLRQALLEGRGARRDDRARRPRCSIPRSAASKPDWDSCARSRRANVLPRRSPSTARTRSPSTSPGSC